MKRYNNIWSPRHNSETDVMVESPEGYWCKHDDVVKLQTKCSIAYEQITELKYELEDLRLSSEKEEEYYQEKIRELEKQVAKSKEKR